MAAVPEFGRAARVEPSAVPGADATQDLYRRFSGQIYGYCLHQLGSREEAEDAVQTTFMNVFRGLQSGIVPRLEGAWVFKIAHNVCLSRRRSTRRRGRVEAPNNFEVLQEIVPARDRSSDELIPLHDALETMPETQRRAILLREWQGLSYREIADELGVSQAAVETLIFRARRALAAGLRAPADGPRWRKRAQYSVDASGLLAAAKAIFGTGSTVKVVAAVAALTTTAVATTEITEHHASKPTRTRVPAAAVVQVASRHAHTAPVRTGHVHVVARTHAVGRVRVLPPLERGQHRRRLHPPAAATVPDQTVPRASAPAVVVEHAHASPRSAHGVVGSPAKQPTAHVKVAHAYGHAKHADKVVPTSAADDAPAAPATTTPPATEHAPPAPPTSPGKSDEAHGHGA